MSICIDDYSKNDSTVFVFNDNSEIEAKQNHQMSPPSFIISKNNIATEDQKKSIQLWSGCPVI
jgi:hypothetical protein